jgi:hypothetical protein
LVDDCGENAEMDATDWAQIASAVFTAVAAAAALLAVRRAGEQNETARESIAAQLRSAERTEILTRKPVLAFIDDPDGGAWELRNVGRGPALNVLVAQRDPQEGTWTNPVLAPPLDAGRTFRLAWLGRVNETGLGVVYTDSEGQEYTSTLGGERMRTYDGNRLPVWSDDEKQRYWTLREGEAIMARWSSKESDFRTG